MSNPQYLTTATAARLLGVSATTVKRMVDGGTLPAHRTAGGHRKILLDDVQRFLRQGCTHPLPGGEPAGGPVRGAAVTPDPGPLAEQLFVALQGGDAPAARRLLLGAHDAGLRVDRMADEVVAPAMHRLGHEWETDRLDVFQEHRGTQQCLAALHAVRARLELTNGAERPLAVGGCPEGDHYLLPTLLAEMVLLECGWRTVNVGPNTPLASLRRAVLDLRPRLLWLSVSYLPDPTAFLSGYRALYEEAERQRVAVAVGGRVLSDGLRRHMPYTTYGDRLGHLAAFARSLHPQR